MQPQNAQTPDALPKERSEGPSIAGHENFGVGFQCGGQNRDIRRIGQVHRLRLFECWTARFLDMDDQGGGGFKRLHGTVRTLQSQVAPRVFELLLG